MSRALTDEEMAAWRPYGNDANGEPEYAVKVFDAADKHGRLCVKGYWFGTQKHSALIDRDNATKRVEWLESFRTQIGLDHVFAPDQENDIDQQIQTADIQPRDQHATDNLREPVLIELSDVEETAVRWVWDKWLPEDSLTVLDGDPGTGKSQITCDLAARITTGRPLPPTDGEGGIYDPRNVVFLTLEDDPSKVLRPRLRVAGADISRVSLLTAVRDSSGDETPIDLYSNIPQLAEVIERKRPALVVVDPITSFAGGMDLNRDTEARTLLQPVLTLANDAGTTLLLVRHLNKKEGMSALYRGGGSIGGIIGICRAGWIVQRSPEDRETFVLAMNKSNYAKFPKSLTYCIESAGDTSRVSWEGESEITAVELMGKKREPSKVEGCTDFLREQLAGARQIASDELQRMAKAAGYSSATYYRARKLAGVKADHEDGFDGGWVSYIPEAEPF